MITENEWQVRKHQDLTRAPCAQRTSPCRSRIPRPERKAESASAQTRQRLAMGLQAGSRDLLNACCA